MHQKALGVYGLQPYNVMKGLQNTTYVSMD